MEEDSLDAEEFEELFCKKERKILPKVEKVEDPKDVSLIDSKLFNNLAITLRKLPKVAKIEQGLLTLDSEILNVESLELLINNLPDPESIAAFKAVKDNKPVSNYAEPENLLLAICNIPEFGNRLKCWMYSLQFENSLVVVDKPLEAIEKSLELLKQSEHFKTFLGVVLAVGNYLNGGTKKGQAEGFQVDIISKLEETKDNSKGTLMDYCIKKVLLKDENFEEIITELQLVGRAKEFSLDDIKVQVESLVNNLKDFKNRIKNVQGKLEKDDVFIVKMSNFFKNAKVTSDMIEKRYEKMQLDYKTLLKFFSYKDRDIPKTDTKTFFGTISQFLDAAKRSLEKIKKEKSKEKAPPAKGRGAKISSGAAGEDAMSAMVDKIKNDLKKQ